jgi:hypothetical protein
MTSDSRLTLPEVMAVSRHQRLSSLDPYLRPRVDDIFDRLQRHYTQPKPVQRLTPGYDAEDFRTVFGG